MPMEPLEGCYCEKCGRVMGPEKFYGSNNLEKYPDGKLHQCKECISMHVDNWDPETYTWILQECDVPYLPEEWNKLMQGYARDPSKLTGKTILGKYLSKMRLKKWKDYRWKDNDFLQELEDTKVMNTMKRLGYEAADIEKTLQTGRVPPVEPPPPSERASQEPIEDYFAKQFEEDCVALGLTEEDQTYLRLKWGKGYKPEEWVSLEQLYVDMINSYDIESAGDINTLKLACKTSLKSNQLLDIGD